MLLLKGPGFESFYLGREGVLFTNFVCLEKDKAETSLETQGESEVFFVQTLFSRIGDWLERGGGFLQEGEPQRKTTTYLTKRRPHLIFLAFVMQLPNNCARPQT